MMEFEDTAGLAQLEAMSPQGLNALAFGAVRMRADGEVVAYTARESGMAGLSKERVLGRNFFSAVAPCSNNYLVAQRFLGEPELDATLDYVFTLRMKPTPVTLRLLKSAAAADYMYLLVQRLPDGPRSNRQRRRVAAAIRLPVSGRGPAHERRRCDRPDESACRVFAGGAWPAL